MRYALLVLAGIGVAAAGLAPDADAGVRIKDITDLQGARPNFLRGVGLVVGLDNTGGRSSFTNKTASDMLQRFNISTRISGTDRADSVYQSGNVSVVVVTAELGPFSRVGSRIDVTVSVLDNATSLQGGHLISTPLLGPDSVVYAVAQGSIINNSFLFANPTGAGQPLASAQKNHPTVGKIPGGAIVEREVRGEVLCNGQLRLMLREPDYVSADNIAKAINAKFPSTAVTLDAGTIQIAVPRKYNPDVVGFIGEVGRLEVTPDAPAKVIINERIGAIVAGKHVKIASVAVTTSNLAILTNNEPVVSQPPPFSRGSTTVVPRATVGVTEQGGTLRILEDTTTVADLARAMNALGATPRDMIAIFQTLRRAGALHAELVVE